MSNVLAGIGRGQLKVLDKRIQRKREIFEYYRKELGQLEGIEMMPVNEWNKPNFWLSTILVNQKIKPIDIIKALENENIEARPVWKPMHTQPLYKGYEFIGKGVSEKLFEQGVCLPSDTKMTDNDLDRIVSIIKGLLK